MDYKFNITNEERDYIRELAKKYLEYANLPVMEERTKLWYAHNELKSQRPVIIMEMETFKEDMLKSIKCTTPEAIEIERNLLEHIINFELINDDKVISPYYSVYWKISIKEFGLESHKEYASDTEGRNIGFAQEHVISDLKEDFGILKPSIYNVDREYTLAWKEFIESVIGDIMPVKIKNNSLDWHTAPSMKVVELMGLEKMMYAMMDYPQEMHKLYDFIMRDMVKYIKWQENEGLLTLNNGNDYAGSGSYGFAHELPTENYKKTGKVQSIDRWGNMNSQESVGISPDMYKEFIYPYYYNLAKEFGLVYYGCCEPVHDIWEDCVSKIPNLRKVSISPWCDENIMGEYLKGNNVIYSRKPSPNFIGVGDFDELAFTEHITKTLKAAKGCTVEFSFRDIYTLNGDIGKPGKAVKIVRNLIEKHW